MSFPDIRLLSMFFISISMAASVFAQSTQGTLLGIVKDTSGAVIPDAYVRITYIGEGSTRTYQTNEFGEYRAADLSPGAYRIEVSKNGFRTGVLENVEVSARQERRQDWELTIGIREDILQVNSTVGALMNTESPNIASSFDSKAVLELPVISE